MSYPLLPSPQQNFSTVNVTARNVINQAEAISNQVAVERQAFVDLFKKHQIYCYLKKQIPEIKKQIQVVTELLSDLTANRAKTTDVLVFWAKQEARDALKAIPNHLSVREKNRQRELLFLEASEKVNGIIRTIDRHSFAKNQDLCWDAVAQELHDLHFRLGEAQTSLLELETMS